MGSQPATAVEPMPSGPSQAESGNRLIHATARHLSPVGGGVDQFAPQHFLYFLPDPQEQGSLRPTLLLLGKPDLTDAACG